MRYLFQDTVFDLDRLEMQSSVQGADKAQGLAVTSDDEVKHGPLVATRPTLPRYYLSLLWGDQVQLKFKSCDTALSLIRASRCWTRHTPMRMYIIPHKPACLRRGLKYSLESRICRQSRSSFLQKCSRKSPEKPWLA